MKKLALLLLLIGAAVGTLHYRYGAGAAYPDLTTAPLVDESGLELVLEYPEPVGNVAVSGENRLFFTVHPESRPEGNKLLEWVNGAAQPYPNGASQAGFDTILGVFVDNENRLWVIDHGNHGFRDVRLVAIDLDSSDVVHERRLDRDVAPWGSLLQDLRVDASGRYVFIADASIWRQQAALIVYDSETRQARRVLEGHPSVAAQDYLIRTPAREMRFFGGLVSLKAGVDGLAVDADNEWLYYAAINHDGLFRIPVAALIDVELTEDALAAEVERVSNKPLSDGLSIDAGGDVFITDVEHGAVLALGADGALRTVVKSERIRWADGLSLGPDGWFYLADSAIPELVLRSSRHIAEQSPYRIFRFRSDPTTTSSR